MEAEIKTYGKGELASLYMPDVQPSTARRVMVSWIECNEKLKAELLEAGYRERAVLLTPRQVEILFKHLGRP
ncbi:DUF4248 domain-containing protein [Bacteroides sp. OttesenSCG-928-E20]|nr:DUF4248 domain-containing protein [Bacteroides sp. OttesenSCG-928-E20]